MATTSEVFETQHLNAHNNYRARHGCPPLELSAGLCNFAQDWAEELAASRLMEHRSDSEFGENLFMTYSQPLKEVNGEQPVDSWYAELKYYDFESGRFSCAVGHFTQVVWKETIELGVGKAINEFGESFVVTNYYPAGNVYGQFKENVPPLLDSWEDPEVPEVSEDPVNPEIESFTHFETNHLTAHNILRANHGCPPLELSRQVCQYAQEWASYLASEGTIEIRPDSEYGENVYMVDTADPLFDIPPEKPVNRWYEEEQTYDYACDDFSATTGHFTQVIWRSSVRMGVGRATNESGETYVVTNYDPPGNCEGQFHHNVPPKCV